MRKIFVILAVFLLSLPVVKAQRYYFFCVNIGGNSDGAYIARTINGVLSQLDRGDVFTVYIRGGISKDGKIFDSEVVEDMERWNEMATLLGYVEEYSVLPKPELDNMLRLFQNRYQVEAGGLRAKEEINVYWFGDQNYFKSHSQDLFLKFYYACAGGQTWKQCTLCPDRAGAFGNKTIPQLLNSPSMSFSNVLLGR